MHEENRRHIPAGRSQRSLTDPDPSPDEVRGDADSSGGPRLVVGIGASAGGLESLERLFAAMPETTGMAFVVIQHLSPDFKSVMDELLARRTRIPIRTAVDGMRVEPDTIYLMPARKEMIVSEGRLLLTDKDPDQDLTLPIDRFFRSLAQDYGPRGVAVILSGTGSDGSRGLRDVKQAGGLVIAESETSAKFDGMPSSARDTGLVDYVADAAEIPRVVCDRAQGDVAGADPAVALAPALEGIGAIFDLLRAEYDIDFSHYKPSTVTRRIDRRLSLVHASDLEEYVQRLRDDPAELNSLYYDLLIGVTRFFRDSDAFEFLAKEVLPGLIESVAPDREVRGWVAGCATGEEAYSLAILLAEELERRGRAHSVKLFATDVHRASLEIASAGVYAPDQLADVTPARLERFFERRADGYHVVPDIRRTVVFAPHNVIKDAPFTKLDVVACRNLLIYFQPHAQRKALSLFHFGLRTSGVLFLGSSESPGDLSDEFEPLGEHVKIYRKRRDVRLTTDFRTPPSRGMRELVPVTAERPLPGDGSLLATYDRLLDRFMPMSLLVNERRELIDVFNGAEAVLRVKARRPSRDVLDQLDPSLKSAIAGGLRRAEQARTVVRFSAVMKEGAVEQRYRITVEPIPNAQTRSLQFLISFETVERPPARTGGGAQRGDGVGSRPAPAADELDATTVDLERLRGLEEELRFTKENLQASIEELETSNEELQATNEELVASNEELQSTNEELHSVNEELFTVNSEYQKKIAELNELNRDMSHLLESTEVGTIFLDRDLNIRKFTPRVADAFPLMPQDIGRPLAGFAHKLEYDGLMDRVREVLQRDERFECEVRDHGQNCLFLRILPYRTPNEVEGVVLTLTEINALDRARTKLKELSAIVEQSEDAIFSKGLDGTIRTWNAGAERLYGWKARQIVGQHVNVLLPDDRKDEFARILRRVRRGGRIDHMETLRRRKDGTLVDVSVTISPIRDITGRVVAASAIARDISSRVEAERKLRASEERYQDLYQNAPDCYVTVDTHTRKMLDCNATLLAVLQLPREQVVDRPFEDVFEPASRQAAAEVLAKLVATEQVDEAELRMRAGDGTSMDVSLRGTAVRDAEGRVVGGRFILRDVTRRKRVELELRREVHRRERFLAMLSHELRNPLHAVRSSIQLMRSRSDAETARRTAGVIERQTAHMSRLLDDLLDIARITQDKLDLKLEPVDLAAAVEDAVETVRPLLDERGIRLDLEILERPLSVRGDRTRLQQAHANLLANAARFSPHGARVSLTARREEESVVVRVKDEGRGIASEMLDKVFELFVQAHADGEPADRGLGVGLTLVRSIVTLHGGSVEAHSEGPGKGAEFTVRLPLLHDAHVIPEESAITAAPLRTVLVVEDLEDSRETLKELLQLRGFRVITASDGEEGLTAIRRRRPDVALIDIGLPKLNGYELARRARATPNLPPIRLIAITGWGQAEDVERAKDAGFDDHLVKPVDLDKLARILS